MDRKERIRFVLFHIKTERFSILPGNYNSQKDDNINLGTGITFKFDMEGRQIACLIDNEFIQEGKPLLALSISCHFKISDDSWTTLTSKNNKIVFPKEFLTHLALLSVGTARGALFAKTEGSPFSAFLLPTIDIADFVKEDAEMKLDNKPVSKRKPSVIK